MINFKSMFVVFAALILVSPVMANDDADAALDLSDGVEQAEMGAEHEAPAEQVEKVKHTAKKAHKHKMAKAKRVSHKAARKACMSEVKGLKGKARKGALKKCIQSKRG